MSNVFIGIDCNTKQLAVAKLALDGSWIGGEMLPVKVTRGAEARERLYQIDEIMRTYWQQHGWGPGDAVVYVEEVPFVQNRKAVIDLSYVVSCVLTNTHNAGHLITPVNVSTWKMQVVGNGKAEKPEIRRWAVRNIKGIPDDLVQDLYDAACIAFFAWRNNVNTSAADGDSSGALHAGLANASRLEHPDASKSAKPKRSTRARLGDKLESRDSKAAGEPNRLAKGLARERT